MTSIFMVHSVLAVNETGKVRRDLRREANDFSRQQNADHTLSFSDVLQREVEECRKDSIDCRTTTYGMDGRLHQFQYRAREYHY